MIRVLIVAAAAALTLQKPAVDSGALVELDVAVVDRNGAAVVDLRDGDFKIKENGKPVAIQSFTPVALDGMTPDTGRHLVLLLDDTLPMQGTAVVQQMANGILSRSRQDDEVTVVRLNNDRDEPFGDLDTAVSRITSYHAGAVPFQRRGTAERMFKVLTGISKQLEVVEHRRKLVVCIGFPNVCNVLEPQPQGYSPLWPGWVAAMTSTARANVSVYGVLPVGPGTIADVARGLVEFTGGNAFYNTSEWERFVDSIWREASRYYLISYWPPKESKRELYDVDVKVQRKGVRVRARMRR